MARRHARAVGFDLTVPGNQIVQVVMIDQDNTTVLGSVVYRATNNLAASDPVSGYTAGLSGEASCGFGAEIGESAYTPITPIAGFHNVHLIVDASGARCGIDGIDLFVNPAFVALNANFHFEVQGGPPWRAPRSCSRRRGPSTLRTGSS